MYVLLPPFHCTKIFYPQVLPYSPAIVLSCLKLTTEEIHESVLSCNTDKLSVQVLKNLESLAPNANEVCDDVQLHVYYSCFMRVYITICFCPLI